MTSHYYVYILLDPRKNNRPFYVGKGNGDRDISHLNETENRTINPRKYATIQSIKNAGLQIGIDRVLEGLEEDEAYLHEDMLIRLYGRKDFEIDGILMNLCLGSNPPNRTGTKHKKSTLEKMRAKALARPPRNAEYRKNISISKSGENHPNWGKSHPPERIERIRLGNLGKKRSAETKQRMIMTRLGKLNLTVEDVREIRRLRDQGKGGEYLQKKFPFVDRLVLLDLAARRTYKSIK